HTLSLLLIPSLAMAQGLALDDAVKEALGGSPKVERAASKAEEAAWGKTEALSGFLPSITLDANHIFEKKYMLLDINLGGNPASIAQVVPTTLFTLSAQIPLFDGLRNVNRFRAARAMENAARDESDWMRFQTEQEVGVLFYRALGSQALRDVAQQNAQTLEDHLKDVKAFQKAGIATNYEVLRVEVQASEARSELLNSTDNVEIARARLSEAIGRASDDRVLEGALPEPKEDWISKLDLNDNSGRKDLAAVESAAESARLQDTVAGRFWVPRIGAFGQYQYYNNRTDSFADWDVYRNAYLVGINLSWNLFDGMGSIARAKQAAERRVQGEKTLELATLHSKQELDLWRRKFLYQCAVFRSRQSDVSKTDESVRLAKSGRKAGTRTNTDLLDAEAEAFRSKAGLVNAQIGALEALSNLQLALGRKIQ
ncbi:MAG: TolC family protein, partial [Bdellovibrionota bacterium]